ncbi:MAG: GNAT family N-acetyltransferase [bacterium]|nr:GNAT family N-acetyltransferase [bacterium]
MADDWRTRWGHKIKDMQAAISLIKSGDHIFVGSGAAAPTPLLVGLTEHRDQLLDHEVVHILTLGDAPHVHPDLATVFRHNALFIGGNTRKAVQDGYADYTPIFLSEIPGMLRSGRIPVDVALVQVSPPDRHGFCSLGVDVGVSRAGIAACKVLIAEVNNQMPRTHGDTFVHADRIEVMIETDRPLHEMPTRSGGEDARRIGRHVAELIEDGSTLQMGIGAIPDAVLEFLGDKKDLGIHTEMFSDGAIELIEKGIINNRRKTLHRGKAVVSFVMGTRKLYDFVADNAAVEFHPCDYTNDPFVIAQNEKMVAINTTLEVDLTGQVCSDSIGAKFYSGIGGQVDFIRGAARSKGGKPIIALPSTAQGETVSRIVPALTEGAGVVTTRGDVHYVVTEYGVAHLHGKKVRERALALIQIAHPKFRPWLLAEAKQRRYIFRDQKDIPVQIPEFPEDVTRRTIDRTNVQVLLRAVRPTDESPIRDLFHDLELGAVPRSLNPTSGNDVRHQIHNLCNVDYEAEMGIVACLGNDPAALEICAMAGYRVDRATGYADLAFGVSPACQGRGIGTLLMEHMARVARRRGVKGFSAVVLPKNTRMMGLFEKLGFPLQSRVEDEMTVMTLSFVDRDLDAAEVGPPALAALPVDAPKG